MSEREHLARKVLDDLSSGMEDTAIMEQYGLSYEVLRDIYKDLFDSGLLRQSYRMNTGSGRSGRPPLAQVGSSEAQEVWMNRREQDRYRLYFDVPVYESERSDMLGAIRDVSEHGVGVFGVDADVDEIKFLVVDGESLSDLEPFEFEARCCWARRDALVNRIYAGFRITEISEEDLSELRKLIEVATL